MELYPVITLPCDNFTLMQLKKCAWCFVRYCDVVKQAGWNFLMYIWQIAEQLIMFNRIYEDAILQMDLNKARRDIGTALLTNSSNCCNYFCNAFLFLSL